MICICFKFISSPSVFLCVSVDYFTFDHQDFCLMLSTALFLDWEHMATFVSWIASKVLCPAWTYSSEWEVDYRETQPQKIKQDVASRTAEWFWVLTVPTLERMSTRLHKDTHPYIPLLHPSSLSGESVSISPGGRARRLPWEVLNWVTADTPRRTLQWGMFPWWQPQRALTAPLRVCTPVAGRQPMLPYRAALPLPPKEGRVAGTINVRSTQA